MSFIDNQSVADRLKIAREMTNLSARKFAMDAGVDQSQYAKIEKAELPITVKILEKLAQAHNLDSNYILYGTYVPHETQLLKAIEDIRQWQIDIDATIAVMINEIASIRSNEPGKSFSSVVRQLKIDIENERKRLSASSKKE